MNLLTPKVISNATSISISSLFLHPYVQNECTKEEATIAVTQTTPVNKEAKFPRHQIPRLAHEKSTRRLLDSLICKERRVWVRSLFICEYHESRTSDNIIIVNSDKLQWGREMYLVFSEFV